MRNYYVALFSFGWFSQAVRFSAQSLVDAYKEGFNSGLTASGLDADEIDSCRAYDLDADADAMSEREDADQIRLAMAAVQVLKEAA